MLKPLLGFAVLVAAALSWAHDKQDNWLQISSQHFTVISDGSEKQARHIGEQLERMRLVFQTAFPNLRVDPSAPIVVIAMKDAKGFRALEPEAYLAKGQLELAGLFLRAPDKNYILLRMDAGGEHPYASIYHEYTHLLFSKVEWIPLWFNEGMAEFYQNTEISEKDTVLGKPSPENIIWLRQNRLLPLPILLAVDHNSPYYHEEQKGSIFYAESWALVHYLEVKDVQNRTDKVRDYLVAVGNSGDPVAAATQVFGDLKQLQDALESYIRQYTFNAFKLTKALPVNDSVFKVQPITAVQADAVRADFLAYNNREKDSRSLLEEVLHDEPNNVLAHETMGYLEFRGGNLEQAENWYRQAVQLDSQSYLANYYFGAIALNRGESGAEIDKQIESSLQKAIKLNPQFAPSYDSLALFYGRRHENLDQAHMLTLQAVELDPANVHYRVNSAYILMSMHRENDAIAVLETALKLAKTPQEVTIVQNQLQAAQQFQAYKQSNQEMNEPTAASASAASAQETEVEEETLIGPRRTVIGTIRNVHCSGPASLDADIDGGATTISVHASNYYKIQFSAVNYTPKPEFQPCSDLEGMRAKVQYIESAAPKTNGLVAIELHK
jgi:tetratricopeptide (TPR) repeat protein